MESMTFLLERGATTPMVFSPVGSISSYGPVSGSLAATSADAIIFGSDFNEVGRAVAPAGDLNGDGFGDIILGTDAAGFASGSGQVFIFNGPLTGERSVTTADATITGSFANESSLGLGCLGR